MQSEAAASRRREPEQRPETKDGAQSQINHRHLPRQSYGHCQQQRVSPRPPPSLPGPRALQNAPKLRFSPKSDKPPTLPNSPPASGGGTASEVSAPGLVAVPWVSTVEGRGWRCHAPSLTAASQRWGRGRAASAIGPSLRWCSLPRGPSPAMPSCFPPASGKATMLEMCRGQHPKALLLPGWGLSPAAPSSAPPHQPKRCRNTAGGAWAAPRLPRRGGPGESLGGPRPSAARKGGAGARARRRRQGSVPGCRAGPCVLTHLDRLSFPAAKWLCTVCQRPRAAFPVPGSLWAETLLLMPSSPSRCFSPGRPSRSPANPAAADAVSLAPDNREPLGRVGGRTPPRQTRREPDGQTDGRTWKEGEPF